MTPTPRLLTLAEAAPLVGLSATSLRLYAERGTLRATKVGKTWVVTEREVARFAALPRRMGRPVDKSRETA